MEEDAHELVIGDLDPAIIVSVDLAKSLCELLDSDASTRGQLMRSDESLGSSRTGRSDQK